MAEAPQSYSSHARIDPLFHRVLTGLLLLTLLGALFGLFHSFGDSANLHNALMFLALTIAVTMAAFFARVYALKAQDRAIRAEENLRHFVLTGKLLDQRLGLKQIVGLRFASDEEFPVLAERAAREGLSQDGIKKAIKSWRADHDRL